MVCQRRFPREHCTIFELSPAEEALLIKRKARVPEEFVYCHYCWNIIKDPEAGPRLMRDTAERQMLQLGVAPQRAREISTRYFDRLIQLQRQRNQRMH